MRSLTHYGGGVAIYTKIGVMSVILVSFLGSVRFSSGYAGEGTAPPSEAAKNIGPVLVKAYTFVAVHPNSPDHLWLDEGNGQVQFMMFDKAVSDPTAVLLFVSEGIKGRFCAESQPDGGKTGFNHFHRINTPATGDTSMHGQKGEEGYWLKHVAVGDFEMEHTREHGTHGGNMHYKTGHHAGCVPAADTQVRVILSAQCVFVSKLHRLIFSPTWMVAIHQQIISSHS